MKKDRIDQILEQKLKDFSFGDIPAWAEMERRLVLAENEKGIQPRRRYLNTVSRYAAAAVILLLIGIGVYRYQDSILQDQMAEEKTVTTVAPASSSHSIASDQNMTSQQPLTQILQSARRTSRIQTKSKESIVQKITESASQTMRAITEQSQRYIADAGETSIGTRSAQSGSSVQTELPARREPLYFETWDNDTKKKNRTGGAWSASLHSGSLLSSQDAASNLMSNTPFNAAMVEASSLRSSNFSYVGRSKLDHKFPVSVGLNVRKYLTNRLALETGLHYSYLQSTGELSADFEYNQKQKLHYLGIPLTVSYDLIKNPRWNVYVRGGGMAEFAVSAKLQTKLLYNGNLQSKFTEDISANGALWSINAGMGASYNFLPRFGVYLEPGVNYYFSNSNHPTSYYTAYPWSFNLRIGFRVNF